MKSFVLILAICCLALSSQGQTNFVTLSGEARIPVPAGWEPGSDRLSYPFRLVHPERKAEILVFKSKIAEDEIITSEAALKTSVDDIIADVIMSLPNAKLLTSSGFYEIHRAGFLLEFISSDSVTLKPTRHQLKGILYQHPGNYQLLFTIWAKCEIFSYPELAPGIHLVEDQFTYTGVQEVDVFGGRGSSRWPIFMLIVVAVALLLYFRPRQQRDSAVVGSPGTHFWHCNCGRLNHLEQLNCRRCGREQVPDRVL